MKRTVVFVILFAFCSQFNVMFSQERVNDEMVKINDPKLTLDNTKGWYKDTNGQWISKKNSMQVDNFKRIKIYTASYNGNDYIILMKIYVTGYYKYPNIKVDWVSLDMATCYIIKKEDFKIEIKENEACINKIVVRDKTPIIARSNIKDLEKELNQAIKRAEKNKPSRELEIPTFYSTQGNVIRFILNEGLEIVFRKTLGKFPEDFYYECEKKKFENFFLSYKIN